MIRFRKLYQKLEEGWENNAIIAYAKRPSYISVVNNKEVVEQYVKFLAIDLWVVRLSFRWKTKYKIN